MSDQKIMQRLIWKDVLTIKPLVWAGLILVIATNLCLFLAWRMDGGSDSGFMGWSIFLWIFIPNLVALGAPAYLIGSEEESGTIRWLRSLPIRWQQLADAKLYVAFGATAVVWGLSSLVLWLNSFGWSTANVVMGERVLVSPPGILATLFCSMMLLLLGFVTSYLIRSPLLALITLIPTYLVALIVVLNLIPAFGLLDRRNAFGLPVLIAVTLTSLWIVQRLLAWRRLRSYDSTLVSTALGSLVPTSRYRPRALPMGSKPSQVQSLLWQQVRQTGPLCLALLVVSALLAMIALAVHASPGAPGIVLVLGGISSPLIMLSASWFGAMVFYGDNVHRRCSFLADRGISPTRVWWTRIVPPATACLLLIAFLSLIALATHDGAIPGGLRNVVLQFIVMAVVLFAFGQLVSQWTEKPLLAFFAAPAYTFVSILPILYLLDRWGGSFSVILITVPVLLLATWRLTGRWLEGRINRSYTARVVGYTAIAVLLPCLWLGLPHWLPAAALVAGYAIQLGVMP